MVTTSYPMIRLLLVLGLCFLGSVIGSPASLVLPTISNSPSVTSKYGSFYSILYSTNHSTAAHSLTLGAHLPVTPFDYHIPSTLFILHVTSPNRRLSSTVNALTVFLDATRYNMMQMVDDAEKIVEPHLLYKSGEVELVLEATHPEINVGNLAFLFDVGGLCFANPRFVYQYTGREIGSGGKYTSLVLKNRKNS